MAVGVRNVDHESQAPVVQPTRHTAVVHAADGIRLVSEADCPHELTDHIVKYIAERCDDVLWPWDASEVRAFIANDRPFLAIALYFSRVGDRWDDERLDLRVGRNDSRPCPDGGLGVALGKPYT